MMLDLPERCLTAKGPPLKVGSPPFSREIWVGYIYYVRVEWQKADVKLPSGWGAPKVMAAVERGEGLTDQSVRAALTKRWGRYDYKKDRFVAPRRKWDERSITPPILEFAIGLYAKVGDRPFESGFFPGDGRAEFGMTRWTYGYGYLRALAGAGIIEHLGGGVGSVSSQWRFLIDPRSFRAETDPRNRSEASGG